MKLQLFISHNGGISRRKAFDHILAGEVSVNGKAVREPSHMMDPGEDKITLEGREIKLKDYEYIMLNKPVGYVTTCETQFDQWGVLSLLPPNLRHLKPVGRLDKDTQGLLFLTNDGELAHRLAHPSFDVNKTYHVRVARRLEFREKDRLEQGVVIEKFKTAPAEVANVTFDGNFTEFDLTIHEGHKHQVRLMCHEVGHDVVRLTRVAQGPLRLDTLKSGAWRPLTPEEQASLHAIGRAARPLKPVFSSNSPQRRFSANRDWQSGRPSSAGAARPETRSVRPAGERSARPESDEKRSSRPDERRTFTPRPRSDKPYGHKTYSGKSSPVRRTGRS